MAVGEAGPERMEASCRGATVVVFVLTKDFLWSVETALCCMCRPGQDAMRSISSQHPHSETRRFYSASLCKVLCSTLTERA